MEASRLLATRLTATAEREMPIPAAKKDTIDINNATLTTPAAPGAQPTNPRAKAIIAKPKKTIPE